MVDVIFPNGCQRQVANEDLDALIDQQEIVSFHRAGGWAILGRDPVRTSKRPTLCIPERRRQAFRSFDQYLKSLKP